MELTTDWFNRLVAAEQEKTTFPSAAALIEHTAAPPGGLDPASNRVVVGLIEAGWSNPLFYPEGGFPKGLIEDSAIYLPGDRSNSLLTAFSRARGLDESGRLFGYVVVANPNGEWIAGSRNRWIPFSELTKDQVLGNAAIEYFDESGKKHHYKQSVLPTSLSPKVNTDEFTLDILAVKTFNQYADIAVFIVPDDTFAPVAGSNVDLPDFRLAPLPIDAAGRPLVVSSSHGNNTSMKSRLVSLNGDPVLDAWPDPPSLPRAFTAQDNTGLVMTLSAGDQVSGLDRRDGTDAAQSLFFNTWQSSSPLFLTVGGVSYLKDADHPDQIKGSVAWRHPRSSSPMEGGNGGFTAAAPMPAYQQVSPWIRQFQQVALSAALQSAWTVPAEGAAAAYGFDWWSGGGQPLSLPPKAAPKQFRFFSSPASGASPLATGPTASRQMPDLANLAWPEDFLSVVLERDVDLSDRDWARTFRWHGNGGTSLASPATASLLAATNLRRRQNGLADLSATEVHYLLYQLPPALLTDITALQEPPLGKTSTYPASRGYDYASGLGAIGGTGAARLVEVLGSQSLPLLPERTSPGPDVIFKPGRLPLALASQSGPSSRLRRVSMNGYAVQALLEAAAKDPEVLTDRLLPTLEAIAQRTAGHANAVRYEVELVAEHWNAAAPGTLLNLPLDRFAESEGVAVAFDSLVSLTDLPDITPAPSGQSTGMPAYYSLLVSPPGGGPETTLALQPFQLNQGSLLRQGATMQPSDRSRSAVLVNTALQWPLLQHHVALATGASGSDLPPLRVDLTLRSVAGFANLYGIYPVDAPDGTILDPHRGPLAPGTPGYAALALSRALGDGRNSSLWAAPHRTTRRFDRLQDWSNPSDPRPARLLAEALDPGRTYQHFILPSPSPSARQDLVASLLAGMEPGPEVLARLYFALPSANVDGLGHALGLTADDQTLLSLGFEDLPNLGDRDFNDVIASWSLQEGMFSIGSTVLLDPTADRQPDLALGSRAGSPSTALIITTNSGEIQRHWQPFGADDWSGLQLGAGDVNGDGFDDLVAVREILASDSAGGLGCEGQVLFGQAAPDPNPPLTSSFRAFDGAISGPMSLAVRDLDLDGYAEVVVTASQADPQRRALALEVWSADASGMFRRRTDLPLPSTAALDPRQGYSVALGDLDGNGSVELVLGDLQGGDLFVGSINPRSDTPSPPILPTVLQPYGKGFSSGVLPTVISAQQTLLQRPHGLDDKALPWVVGAPSGSNQALLSGLGTPGALIVKSADPRDPRPAQVPLGWLAGADAGTAPLVAIPWDSRDGAPVFASGGVSYLAPAISSSKPVKLSGSPRPILVSAAAGTTRLNLTAGPEVDAAAGDWQPIAGSTNTIINSSTGSAAGWTNPWTAVSKSNSNPVSNRDNYNQVSVPLVSYKPPFVVDANPLKLVDPWQLLAGLSANASAYIENVIKPWNDQYLKPPSVTTWGPGAPNSPNTPYSSREPHPALPSFKPAFTPLPPGPAHAGVVEQFQQRLISVAMAGMAINYQHHYSPFWYSPQSWVDGKPTVQVDYLTSPELRQTQGIDCTNFTSWNYNDAFGFWINSDTADQAKETEVEVDWLTGDTTLKAEVVATATEIYAPTDAGSPPDKRTVIERLNRHLRPGDLLYLNPTPVNENPKDAKPENASHGITWINDNSSADGLTFVSLPSSPNSTAGGSTAGSSAGGSPTQRPAFIIDSTGSESFDFQHQYYPNGVQIRQFDENAWYVNNVITVHRWLTPDNVRRMDEALRSLSNVDVQTPGTTPVKGAHNFNNSSDRSKTFLLDVDSTNLNGKLYEPTLLPKDGDFKLTLTKGGFSGDLPAQSSSKDVIKLQFLNDGSKQDVAMTEEVSNERGEMETIAGSARGILSGVVNNYIHTRGGDDEIIGSAGVDYIRAGTGDDIIDGGAGNDAVRSGTGNDRITLGAGADKLLITRDQLEGRDTLLDFSAEDSLVLSDGISVLAALGSNTLKVGLANGFFQELVLAGTSLLTWNPAMVTTV